MANLSSIYSTPAVRNIVDSTPASLTVGPIQGATTGTLSATWAFATGTYIITFSNPIQGQNADTRTVTLTNGSASVAWFPGLLNNAGTYITVATVNVASQNVPVSNQPVLLTSSNTTSGIVLAANQKRIGWSIQNQGTNVVQVCLGLGASTSQLHYTLKGGTGAADGTGGSISFFAGAVYNGVVTVSGTSFSVSVVDLCSD